MRSSIFLLSLLFSTGLLANTAELLTVSRVVNVYDGDSFRADIIGLPKIIGTNMPIRIKGIDTPEVRGKCPYEKRLAQQAKRFTLSQLQQANNIELRNVKRGKYFRFVADVYLDGKSLAQQLLDAELAYQYDGGKKQTWCR